MDKIPTMIRSLHGDATTAPNGRPRRVPHWWIEQAAPMLFELMACSGMLRVDPDEAAAWMRTVRRLPPTHSKD